MKLLLKLKVGFTNCPVDELAKSPRFGRGIWRFDPSRDNQKDPKSFIGLSTASFLRGNVTDSRKPLGVRREILKSVFDPW